MNILATFITYNPEYDCLQSNVKRLIEQVDEILIVNNGPCLNDALFPEGNIHIMNNPFNLGIATALNKALEYAKMKGYDYLLTMDQDSYLSSDYVRKLVAVFQKHKQVAIVGPNIMERQLGLEMASNVSQTQEVSHVITSGSLNDVRILSEVGGFSDQLFIDMVDLDICYKVFNQGYKIMKTNEVMLEHTIGDPLLKKGLFKTHLIRNHEPLRKYFFVRNRLYIAFTYKKRGWPFLIKHLIGILYYTFIVLIFENKRLIKLKMIGLGLVDFLRGNYQNTLVKEEK